MNKNPDSINNSFWKIDECFAEFYGILLGDGCISKYKCKNKRFYEIRIDGNKITDYEYYVRFLLPLVIKISKRKPKINYRKDCNGIFVRFHSKDFAEFLNQKWEFPFGKKTHIKIPEKLVTDDKLLRKVLRGFFDTDGCVYFTKNDSKKRRVYPIIELSTHCKSFLKQLEEILKWKGFHAKISHYEDSVKLHGKENLLKWFSIIGSDHPDKLSKVAFWMKFGYCPRVDELNYQERLSAITGP